MRSWIHAAIVLVAAAFTTPSLAQPSLLEVTEASCLRVAKVRTDVEASLGATAQTGVAEIERLDAQGASNATIFHYYLEVRMELTRTSSGGQALVGRIQTSSVATLIRLGAPEVLIARVNEHSLKATRGIGFARAAALEDVRWAAIAAMQ